MNFICCRPNLDFAEYKEQYIDDEITLNEEGMMDFNSIQNKFFMVHQGSLEELVHCAIPKKFSMCSSISINVVKKVVGTTITFSVVIFIFFILQSEINP